MAAARMILVAILLVAGLGHAETMEKRAKERYAVALRDFQAARWAQALDAFRESYRLAPYPGLLFNIAECEDKLGHVPEARAAYEKYLQVAPRSSRRAAVEARLRALAPVEAPVVVAPPVVTPPPVALVAAPAKPAPTPLVRQWWLWTTVGVVVVGTAVGLGLGFGLSASPTPSSFQPNLPMVGPP